MNLYSFSFLGLLIASVDCRIMPSDISGEPQDAGVGTAHLRFVRQFGNPTGQQTTTTTAAPVPGVLLIIPNCGCKSTTQYNPVCGTDGVTYMNRQQLDCARSCGANVQLRRSGSCIQSGLRPVGIRPPANS